MNPYIVPGLKNIIPIDSTKIPNIVCEYYLLRKENVYSRRRDGNLPLARFMIMYLMRTKTRMSLKQIGDLFNRDHTTVINAVKTINGFIDIKDESILNDLMALNIRLEK